MTLKVELRAVAIGVGISISGSVVLTVFVIFWAGFLAAGGGRGGDEVYLWRMLFLAGLILDAVMGLIAGWAAGRAASRQRVLQGLAVGIVATGLGLIMAGPVPLPWRLIFCFSLVSLTSPIFGAKLADWQRQRHALEQPVA